MEGVRNNALAPDARPRGLDDLLREAPDEARREQLRLAFTGSAMDVIDRFFPELIHKED